MKSLECEDHRVYGFSPIHCAERAPVFSHVTLQGFTVCFVELVSTDCCILCTVHSA